MLVDDKTVGNVLRAEELEQALPDEVRKLPQPHKLAIRPLLEERREPVARAVADLAIITTAYEESSPPTKAFMDLLATHPDEWLDIDTVRRELVLGVHELAGVLSTFPRRWRGRYHQSGPLPFDVDGKGRRRRYRMGKEVAELILSLR